MAYRILSLDGGGSWALIQARVLKDIYGDIRGHALLRKFDMVIGNSGGSLVLACLCNDMLLSEIASVFEDEHSRKKVFAELSLMDKLVFRQDRFGFLRGLLGIGPRYSTEKKLQGLVEVLTQHDHLFREGLIEQPVVETPMNELPKLIGKEHLQLLIVGFDYYRERVSFFRSNMNSHTDLFTARYYGMPLGHAIHASSNAPVNFFDEPASVRPFIFQKKPDFREPVYRNTTWFWDGAVSGFNNPVLAGLVEAVTNGADLSDCCILSLGTGTGSRVVLTDLATSNDPLDKAKFDANRDNEFVVSHTSFLFKNDIKKMSMSILDDPPDSATFIAYSFLDPSLTNKANLIRINPCYSPVFNPDSNRYEIPPVYKTDRDGVSKIRELIDLGMDAIENDEVNLIVDLCEKFLRTGEPSLPNQLIRGGVNSDFLGYPTYREARERWQACME